MKKVGLLYGGYSSEFEISKNSAHTIFNNSANNYQLYLIEVKQEAWTVILDDIRIPFDLENFQFKHEGENIQLDAAHIYIHGNPGENGKIQALLDMKGIPYVNSNALASELSFDKWFCNQFLKGLGCNVAKSHVLQKNTSYNVENIVQELGLPLFVKPCDSGSSYGISKVKTQKDLTPAIDAAFQEGQTVVIESFLDGREFTCGVYEDENGIHPLPVTEIISDTDFFDFTAKYEGKSQEITPANLDQASTAAIQKETVKAYQLLQLSSVARVDFMLVNGTPYIIEVNTTPGFSKASIVPQMLAAEGTKISDFWTNIYKFILEK
ncbi:D-alanine--D-alanine ligase family protein [Lishizhenia sp.]|uniref:D-alanine--D-alanine ligase family protein n=1 Tax=Lishizhenia sp. TaxID=2497594 RepID=UPI00299CE0F6|nr:D-alanine--D-alanine ligase family protein [Lishizhenia sp.]MDX1445373.1 D-alanine--D-alanine ligase family protein [Lishizhenia sp.]